MLDFAEILNSAKDCYLILAPQAPEFRILFCNRAYKKVTNIDDAVIGRPLFEVFPDNPTDPGATGVKNLDHSLREVLRTKRTHNMAVQRYDTRIQGSSEFQVKFWKPRNIPVMDKSGEISCIIHSVQDVTDIMLLRRDLKTQDLTAQQHISDAVLTTQEMERMEISRELHDNINQVLNLSRLYFEHALNQDPLNAVMVRSGYDLVKKAMDEVHKMSTALVAPSDEEQELTANLEELLDHVMGLKQVQVVKTIELPDESLIEAKVKLAIVRIVQEQLSNVLKHSEAKNLFFELRFKDNKLYLSIKDDGKGFDMSKNKHGLGFLNMKSRTAMLNGNLTIYSEPGDGCFIEVEMPVMQAAESGR